MKLKKDIMNILYKYFFIIMLFLMIFYLNCNILNPTDLKNNPVIATADIWLPFTGGEYSAKKGYYVDILKFILNNENINMIYKNLSWRECLKSTKKGECDLAVGAEEEESLKNNLLLSKNIWTEIYGYIIIRADDTWQYNNSESLVSKKLGVVEDYAYGEEIDAYIEKYKNKIDMIKWYNGTETTIPLFNDLLSYKIDVAVEEAHVYLYNISIYPKYKNKLKIVKQLNNKKNMYISFSNNERGKKIKKIIDEKYEELIYTNAIKQFECKYIKEK